MNFYFAGGAMEVGGSCIYLQAGGYGIVMDSGIRQGAGAKDPLPDMRGIQVRGNVDAIVVSHAHMDHTGSLPVLSKAFPLAKIYMTKMTMELTRVLLSDSLKLMERREEEIPQYSADDVSAMLSRILPGAYQTPQEILPGVRLTFYPAGHIAGAACVLLTTPEGTVFYSGDVSGFAQQAIEGIGLPRLRPDVMLLESTYGNRLHASRTVEEERLVSILSECMQRGMKALVPSFALGRSQEVLLILKRAMANGKIPHVPVYVDGMIRDMNRVFLANPNYLKRSLARQILKGNDPFYSDDIREVARMESRDDLLAKSGPCIFVASSGMLMGGPSMIYAKGLLPREDACVILTGYQDEEAPGRMLVNLLEEKDAPERKVLLDGVTLPVRARIEMVGLSAHADSTELTGIVEKLSARQVILNHGDEGAISSLAQSLSGDWKRHIYQPSVGDDIDIPVHKKREQLNESQLFPFTLQLTAFDPKSDPERLWNYCNDHYPGRAFTLNQLSFICFGRENSEAMQELMDVLLESGFFTRHPKRLFLFITNSAAQREELIKKTEPTQQDVDSFLHELTRGYPVRKFGFYVLEKRALLTLDFPDAADEDVIREWNTQLNEKTGWTLSIKENTNHQAMFALLRSLFGDRLLNISYYEDRKTYQISLSRHEKADAELTRRFQETTGWKLLGAFDLSSETSPLGSEKTIAPPAPKESESTAASKVSVPSGDWFYPDASSEMTEQNLAFSLIDLGFAESSIRPCKKGRRTDHLGVFMDLSFYTPMLGRRCALLLSDLARQTGWRLHIADRVNQDYVISIAQELCEKYGIPLLKRPSYLPGQQAVMIKCPAQTQIPEELKKDFTEKTALSLLG